MLSTDYNTFNRLQYFQQTIILSTDYNTFNRLQYFQQTAILSTDYNTFNRLQDIQLETCTTAAEGRPPSPPRLVGSWGRGAKSWKIMPNLRRSGGSIIFLPEISFFCKNTCPSEGTSSPAIRRSKVDFPHPDGPKMEINSCSCN